MLQCLERPHRLAYLLGEVWGSCSDPEAAEALEISPGLFRKRLQGREPTSLASKTILRAGVGHGRVLVQLAATGRASLPHGAGGKD